jgi:hypothetical protein
LVPKKKVEFYRKNWSHSSDGLLYYRGLLYVPNEGGARQKILQQHHNHPTAGHFGDKRTEDLVTRKYFWPGLHRDILEYCVTCAVWRQIKAPTHRKYGELQSLLTPTEPWTDITIDFIMGLPASSQYEGGWKKDAILVVVNCFTKLAYYNAVTSRMTAPQLADSITRKPVLRGAGLPNSIVTDRDTQFT